MRRLRRGRSRIDSLESLLLVSLALSSSESLSEALSFPLTPLQVKHNTIAKLSG
jgi:hypothetical protein